MKTDLVRIERVVLEHHGDIAVFRIEIVDQAVADEDVAVGDLDQPGHEIERRRFAAAGRPDQRHELAVLDRQRHMVDGHHVAVHLDQTLQNHLSHRLSLRRGTGEHCPRISNFASASS